MPVAPPDAPVSQSPERRNTSIHLWLTAATLLWALGFLLTRLTSGGFWIDELYTLHSIRLGWREMVMERLDRGHFPGYFALVRLWYSMWPERMFEVALRSMSVLFYALAVASFWPLARRVLTAPASWVALALFASNGVALRQASEARMYTVVLLVAVWITRAWLELQRPRREGADAPAPQGRPSRAWAMALVLLIPIGFVISTTCAVLVGSMLIVGLLWQRTEMGRINKNLIIGLLLGLLVFLPGAIIHLSTADRIGISSGDPLAFLVHIVALMPGIQVTSDYYNDDWRAMVLLAIGAVFTVAAIRILWQRRHTLQPWLLRSAMVVALPLVAGIASYPLVELFDLDIMGPPRYFLTLLPLASITGAWALMQLRRPVLVHAMLTVVLMASAYAILTVQIEKFRERVVEYMAPRFQPGDGIIVVPHETADGVELYMPPGTQVHAPVNRWVLDEEAIRAQLEPLSSKHRVWLVWYRGNDSPVIDVAEQMWGPFIVNRPEKPYGIVRVYLFHPQGQRL